MAPTPALAFYHDRITNPYLHMLGDIATIALLLAVPLLVVNLMRRRTAATRRQSMPAR